jgi:Eco57I restriction-modification methylase
MLLDWLHKNRHWPSRDRIFAPAGAGPRVVARLAREKIAGLLKNLPGGQGVSCGIITPDPESPTTEAPSAIVCEFPGAVAEPTLREAQRLAWNFSKSTTLITLQPNIVRTWTCCEPPQDDKGDWNRDAELEDLSVEMISPEEDDDKVADAFEWVRIIAGEHVRSHPDLFLRSGRADVTLLNQLKSVRKALQVKEQPGEPPLILDDDTIHDLIARVIFIQFLWDRKDSGGRAALDAELLDRLHRDDVLRKQHSHFASILEDYHDAYQLFRWLNAKFNGDLFPGKGATPEQREEEWKTEMDKVKPTHLQALAELVSGRFQGRQAYLWKLYSFDVIPLEFISNIYEQFVKAKGAHYTPGALADFILDGVLTWQSNEWDLKVIDPACGSGVFLVKAYMRLIERWRNANAGVTPPVPILKQLLERNLFGVDSDPHAVRVASFSLYLTMCDQLEPRQCLKEVQLPQLRDKTLVCSDFFKDDREGFRTKEDKGIYDVVVGNAPWGRDTLEPPAKVWARSHGWPTLGTDIGTLFLPKSVALTKTGGYVSMIQPTSNLLFNASKEGEKYRTKLFSNFHIEEIFNFAALRFELFEDRTASPCSVITLRPDPPTGAAITYICPKPVKTSRPRISEMKSVYQIVIDLSDTNEVTIEEAVGDPFVWAALFRGGRRDLNLIKKLSKLENLEQLEGKGSVRTRRGATRGQTERVPLEAILDMPLLSQDEEIDNCFLYLDARKLPKNNDKWICKDGSTSLEAFALPQMLVKLTWTLSSERFKAAIVDSDESTGPAFCERGYFSVHSVNKDEALLESAWLALNSQMAVYYLLLSSFRFAAWVPEPTKQEFMRVPLPRSRKGLLSGVHSDEDIDKSALESFGLNEVEKILVEDMLRYTLADYKGWEDSPGRLPTGGSSGEGENRLLVEYCEYFLRVLRAGFGDDKEVAATVFRTPPGHALPMRMVAIHMDRSGMPDVQIEDIPSRRLLDLLCQLDNKLLRITGRGKLLCQRVARVYDVADVEGKAVPTIYIVKPDMTRYWTRSMALRDADDVSADLVTWSEARAESESEEGRSN